MIFLFQILVNSCTLSYNSATMSIIFPKFSIFIVKTIFADLFCTLCHKVRYVNDHLLTMSRQIQELAMITSVKSIAIVIFDLKELF